MNYVILARKPYQADADCDYISSTDSRAEAVEIMVSQVNSLRESNPEGYISVFIVKEDGSRSGIPQIIL